MDYKQIFRKIIQILLPLALGIILLWYLYRNQDVSEMVNVMKKGVRYDILLFSLIFGLLGNVFRGFRWAILIDSLGKRVKRQNTIYAVLGNYAINMALPRVGEIWRVGVISKYEKQSFTKLLGTLFVDRIMDTVVVGLLTMCLFVFNIRFFKNFFSDNPPVFIEAMSSIFSSVWTYLCLAALAALVWLIFVKFKHLTIVRKIKEMMNNIWEGIKSLWKIERKKTFFIQTLSIWVCYFLYFYITFFAFDFTKDLGIRIALIAFAMSSIGVAVPVQGGIGVWHFMVISTLVAFGVNSNDAGAFAFLVFAIQTLWVVVVGLFGIAALPVINKEKHIEENEDVLSPKSVG
jgi:Predicted integral membrane protein